MRKPITWILVADGHRARILKNEVGSTLTATTDHDYVLANPLDHETGRSRPGATHGRTGYSHHSYEGSDKHRQRKEGFLADLAAELDRGAREKLYQRLLLVAPPRPLGDLRASLGDHARALVCGELAVDVTHQPLAELEQRFASLL